MSQSIRLEAIERLRSYPVAPLSDALGKRGVVPHVSVARLVSVAGQ